MSWLLPVTLVLLAGLLVGGLHALFVRWMTRQTEAADFRDGTSEDRTPDDSRT